MRTRVGFGHKIGEDTFVCPGVCMYVLKSNEFNVSESRTTILKLYGDSVPSAEGM
jgi:hypothetical protein